MKIPLKTKKIVWYLLRRVILTKDNLVKRVVGVFFVIRMGLLSTYFSSDVLPDLHCQSSK
jgi:hypothetical protein